ncbi:unnamed protein product, partial [Bubo scandiacus]
DLKNITRSFEPGLAKLGVYAQFLIGSVLFSPHKYFSVLQQLLIQTVSPGSYQRNLIEV